MSTAYKRPLPRWPLLVIALPAAVAVWLGWVGLAALCGFGVIHPFPGAWDRATVNTSVTLPVGVEAYGSYALTAWLDRRTPEAARKFAKWSAMGSLALGMLGQDAYHLLGAAHAARAPWPIVVLVSSLPVVVLGFGAALSHLLRTGNDEPATVLEAHPESEPAAVPTAPTAVPAESPASAPQSVPAGLSVSASQTRPRSAGKAVKRTARLKAVEPADSYATELAAGRVPSLRRIRADLHVGQPKAQAIQAELAASLKSAALAA